MGEDVSKLEEKLPILIGATSVILGIITILIYITIY